MRRARITALLLALVTTACLSSSEPDATRPPSSGGRADLVTAACDDDLTVETTGHIANGGLIETSGVVASRAYPGVLWAHNDSGDTARIFALGMDGGDLGMWQVPNVSARDWEDIAIGPGATSGSWFLYLADTGDNAHGRDSVQVVRVPEPNPATTRPPGPTTIATDRASVLTLRYPDGAHDAEALLVDPDDGTVVLVTKELVGPAGIYVARPPDGFAGNVELRRAGQVALGLLAPATGASVSPDGRVVALRTYGQVFLMRRAARESIADALRSKSCSVDVDDEGQGEAIALLDDGYVTTTEGASAPLHRARPK